MSIVEVVKEHLTAYNIADTSKVSTTINFMRKVRDLSSEDQNKLLLNLTDNKIQPVDSHALNRSILGYLIQEVVNVDDMLDEELIKLVCDKANTHIQLNPWSLAVENAEGADDQPKRSNKRTVAREYFVEHNTMKRSDFVDWMVAELDVPKQTAHSYASTIMKGA